MMSLDPDDPALAYALRKVDEVRRFTFTRRIAHAFSSAMGALFPSRFREEQLSPSAAVTVAEQEFLHTYDLGDAVDPAAYPDGRHWLFDRSDNLGTRYVIYRSRVVEIRTAYQARDAVQLVIRGLPYGCPSETIVQGLQLYTRIDRERLGKGP
jgi:hypothetical protein